jgi:hypothetical protein
MALRASLSVMLQGNCRSEIKTMYANHVLSSVVDPHHFDADPDSIYHPDADPDSEFHLMRIRIQIKLPNKGSNLSSLSL